MAKKLFETADERKIALVAAAGVAAHAIISSGADRRDSVAIAREAFDLAEAFLAEGERRTA